MGKNNSKIIEQRMEQKLNQWINKTNNFSKN